RDPTRRRPPDEMTVLRPGKMNEGLVRPPDVTIIVPEFIDNRSRPPADTSSTPPRLMSLKSASDPAPLMTATPPVLMVVPDSKPPETMNSVAPALTTSLPAEPTMKAKAPAPRSVVPPPNPPDHTTWVPVLTVVSLALPKAI